MVKFRDYLPVLVLFLGLALVVGFAGAVRTSLPLDGNAAKREMTVRFIEAELRVPCIYPPSGANYYWPHEELVSYCSSLTEEVFNKYPGESK